MIKRLSHWGHGTWDVDKTVELYGDLFGLYPKADVIQQEASRRTAIIPIGNQFLEVWSPLDKESLAAKSLKAKGEGLSHLAFIVEDSHAELETLKEKGVRAWEVPVKPDVTPDLFTIFVHPHSTGGILIELVTEQMLQTMHEAGLLPR